ncbi:hypothetical protein HBI75_106300 [Parastagonospora nodorum]|nr:hypothetical protein HBI75_106300 [Parastagonospora nodorum]
MATGVTPVDGRDADAQAMVEIRKMKVADAQKEISRLEAIKLSLSKKLKTEVDDVRKLVMGYESSVNGEAARAAHNSFRLFQLVIEQTRKKWNQEMDKVEIVWGVSNMRAWGLSRIDGLWEAWAKTLKAFFVYGDILNNDLEGVEGHQVYAADLDTALEDVGIADE